MAPLLADLEIKFNGQNYPPYFDPALSALLQVFKQEEVEAWEYTIPDFFDDNVNDFVTLSVNLSEAEAFLSFNE